MKKVVPDYEAMANLLMKHITDDYENTYVHSPNTKFTITYNELLNACSMLVAAGYYKQ